MRLSRNSAACAVAFVVAAAVIFGISQMRSGDSLDTGSGSISSNTATDRKPADREGPVSASIADDGFAEPGGQPDSGLASDPSDESAEAASVYYKPIPVPGDFAGIVQREGRLSEFHEKLEREPENLEWALPLERALEDLLNELLDPSQVAVKLIECRSDSCEILAVGYGEQAMKEWLEMSQTLYESGMLEEWFRIEGPGQFTGGCGGVDIGPGVIGLLCEFSRAASQPDNADADTAGPFSLTAPYPDGVEFTTVPVPDDFVPLFETNAEVYEFHRALQAESVDHSWAPFVENQIIDYFSAIPELESVSYHHIECRMTRCEVQLTILDPQTAIAWGLELANFDDQPWHDLEFTIYNVPADDDLIRILWLLDRKTSN